MRLRVRVMIEAVAVRLTAIVPEEGRAVDELCSSV